MAVFFNWNIEKIKILPFGGIIIFSELINKPIKEEFLIVLFGPLFQLVFSYLLYFILNDKLILIYSSYLFLFNLLPIYPLDGAKILNLIFNLNFSFLKSYTLTHLLSYILIAILFFIEINNFNFIIFMCILFILLSVIKTSKEKKHIFNKFLFERYLYKLEFKKTKKIKNYKQMKRDYKHLFYDRVYITEKEFLIKKFKNNKY